MSIREEVDAYFGHPGFDQRPTPRLVADEVVCARCRHPRWMHAGSETQFGSSACHQESRDPARRCGCVRFMEADL